MTTAFQLNADELDANFVERVKAAFPHKLIEITVTEADETALLLADPTRRERPAARGGGCGGGPERRATGSKPVPVRTVAFHGEAFGQFTEWAGTDAKLYERLVRLIKETAREPFTGLGKPEPLRHQLKGCWPRRIDQEHRLVYRVTEDAITILSCRDHY